MMAVNRALRRPDDSAYRAPLVFAEYRTSDTSRMSIAEITAATNATFEAYFMPVAHTPAQFAEFCRCYSMDVAESVRMEDRAGRLVGLAMLGLRGERGWCGGLGLVPEARGQGLGNRLVEALVGRARLCGARSMQLEVLAQNEPALRSYRNCGFRESRELTSFWGDASLVLDTSAEEECKGPARPVSIELAASAAVGINGLHAPVWPREAASILALNCCEALEIGSPGRPDAVTIFRTPPGGPLEIQLLAGDDSTGIRALLSAVGRLYLNRCGGGNAHISLLDEPWSSPSARLFQELGFRELYRQYEMRLTL
jgi:ribosomal protein S18 acetylase RimI-like enzyme